MSLVRNRRLVSARLRLPILQQPASASHSCITDVGTGTDAWWQSTGLLNGRFDQYAAITDSGSSITVEVTPMVAAWMRGEPNFGFVLRNADENLNAFTNKSCITRYTEPGLELTYY